MPSMGNMQFLLQKEVVPGTPLVNAMKRYRGLKATPSYEGERTTFRTSGQRGISTGYVADDFTSIKVEAPQDYNALMPVLASLIGQPVTTTPDNVNAPTARQHVFTLLSTGERILGGAAPNPVSFTGQWGIGTSAVQFAYLVFQMLNLGVQRGDLTFETSAIARELSTGVTLATAGVTEIPSVPINPALYDVFDDPTWGALGTTKLLACYEAAIAIADTWGRDTPINSAITSFGSLLENEEIDYSGKMQLGFDTVSNARVADYKAGTTRNMRIKNQGPTIGGAIKYGVQIDFPYLIKKVGEFSSAPGSSVVVLPMDYDLTSDPGTGKLLEITLTNTVTAV